MLSTTLTAQDDTLSIFGYIKDEEGNSKENVKVTIEGQSYEAITDISGFYCINGLTPGEYKIKYNYSELEDDYKIKKIQLSKFEKYTDKLEIAFIYGEDLETNIDNYIMQVRNIVKEVRNYAENS